MSRTYSENIDLDDTVVDDFGELESDEPSNHSTSSKPMVRPIHAKRTIVDAFNTINEYAPKSRLCNDLFIRCAEVHDNRMKVNADKRTSQLVRKKKGM